MVVGMDECSQPPLFDLGEDFKKRNKQVDGNLVALQEIKRGSTKEGVVSTFPSQDNCNVEMKPTLSVHEEGEFLHE